MLSCVIIDDEQSCVDTLQLILKKKFAGRVSVSAGICDPELAREAIARHRPDIVFLDVEMPRLDGVSLARSMGEAPFQWVFTTAHAHYALSAIKLSAVDYLLKPISVEELEAAIAKCERRIAGQPERAPEAEPAGAVVRTIPVTVHDVTQYVPVSEIVRIESQSNYSCIHFAGRPKAVVARTLKELQELLAGAGFLRVHHSHLVNRAFITGYRSQDGGWVLVQGHDPIQVSRRRKHEVLQSLQAGA